MGLLEAKTTNMLGVVRTVCLGASLPWYADTSGTNKRIASNGSVKQSNDGSGIISALFDGTASYVLTSSSIALGTTFTIEMFVFKSDNTSTLFCLLAQASGGFQLTHASTTITYAQGGVANIATGTATLYNAWHHVAVVRNGTNARVYVDGISVINITDSTNFGSSPINTGSAPWAPQYFKGKITGVRVTNTAVYTTNFAPPSTLPTAVSGTQLLLNFGASAAPALPWYLDASANHFMTLAGNVSQSNDGGGVVSALFDGTANNYIVSDNLTLGTTFTIEFFALKTTLDSYGTVVDFIAQASGGIQINYVSGSLYYSQGGITNIASAAVTLYNAWHHIACVRNGTNVKVYVDGTSIINVTNSTNFGTSGVNIGAAPAFGQWYQGKITGVRITNTAVYTSNFTKPTTLPTNIAGTQLLLNFGATSAPA
jgi:hypothetical protein